MALLNIFKNKPRKSRKEESRMQPNKEEKKPASVVSTPKPKKISGQAYSILKKPHVTEKATDLTAKNQYVFEVFENSNKNQVKKAVEDVYGVDVDDVRIINIAGKRRRLGRIQGFRQGYKKAIVSIKEGQKIEVLPR